jgi:hypothetical protein
MNMPWCVECLFSLFLSLSVSHLTETNLAFTFHRKRSLNRSAASAAKATRAKGSCRAAHLPSLETAPAHHHGLKLVKSNQINWEMEKRPTEPEAVHGDGPRRCVILPCYLSWSCFHCWSAPIRQSMYSPCPMLLCHSQFTFSL